MKTGGLDSVGYRDLFLPVGHHKWYKVRESPLQMPLIQVLKLICSDLLCGGVSIMSGGGRGEGNYKFRVVFFSDGLTLQRRRQKNTFLKEHLVFQYPYHPCMVYLPTFGLFLYGILFVFHSFTPCRNDFLNVDPCEG